MITAQMVKELREATGAKMMDCKKALTECNGDVEASVAWLRKKNLDTEVGEKPSSEGLLGYFNDPGDNSLTVVEMSASTDFATQSDDFKMTLNYVVAIAVHGCRADVASLNAAPWVFDNPATVGEAVKELAGRLGENVFIKRVERIEGNFGYYIHHDNKQGAVVVLDKALPELGKDLAMHVVFAKPTCLTRDEVPANEVEAEKAVILGRLAEDPKNASKPAAILEKIVNGQLEKFFAKTVLVDQPYYKEGKKTVAQVLAGHGAKVVKFSRLCISGEPTKIIKDPRIKCHQCLHPDCKGICTCGSITVRVIGEGR